MGRRRRLLLVAAAALLLPAAARADPPVLGPPPADVLVQSNNRVGLTIDYTPPSATDDHTATVTCTPPPHTLFRNGTTRVTCVAVDTVTNEQSAPVSFEVRLLAPPQKTAHADGLQANLYYDKAGKHVQLVIIRDGTVAYDDGVPVYGTFNDYAVLPQAVHFRNLDGDVELVVDLFWGGAHCCFWSDVYSYSAEDGTYHRHAHFWGNVGYRIDRQKDFVSADDRFAYEFASYAGSSFPVQVWAYAQGAFTDVTRRYPFLIRQDAARQLSYVRRAHAFEVQGIYAAWAADECLLRRCAFAFRRLAALQPHGPYDAAPPRYFLKHLRRFLTRLGYA